MLWTSLIGIVVFMLLVLVFGQEWWSSSRGILKEQEKQRERQRLREQEKPKEPPKPEG